MVTTKRCDVKGCKHQDEYHDRMFKVIIKRPAPLDDEEDRTVAELDICSNHIADLELFLTTMKLNDDAVRQIAGLCDTDSCSRFDMKEKLKKIYYTTYKHLWREELPYD